MVSPPAPPSTAGQCGNYREVTLLRSDAVVQLGAMVQSHQPPPWLSLALLLYKMQLERLCPLHRVRVDDPGGQTRACRASGGPGCSLPLLFHGGDGRVALTPLLLTDVLPIPAVVPST